MKLSEVKCSVAKGGGGGGEGHFMGKVYMSSKVVRSEGLGQNTGNCIQ